MISYIKGIYTMNTDTGIVIENGSGIGFEISIPMTSLLYKNQIGDQVKVFTYMLVKEDEMSLYGFCDKESLTLFKLLITVNGVGPKAAMSIMSALQPNDLRRAISFEDSKAISQANGIGKKTAERVILELKDKVDNSGYSNAALATTTDFSDNKTEAVNALVALGYSKNEAFGAISNIVDDSLSCEEYIKLALKKLF